MRTNYDGGHYPSDHFPVTTTLSVVPVPEPASVVLGLLGAAGLWVMSRRRLADRERS